MKSAARKWRIDVGGEKTSALVETAPASRAVFVCAHGAGGNMEDASMRALAASLREHAPDIDLVRFNFLYSEKGVKRPDRMPKVIDCYGAVVDRVRAELAPRVVVLGGRSMGGRAASMMAADPERFPCDGLVLYAYPLHPAGQPDKLRDAHLPAIQVPVMCFNGTRDDLCTPALMKRALETVRAPWQQIWLDAADHAFHVLKSSGATDAAVLASVVEKTRAFITSLAGNKT